MLSLSSLSPMSPSAASVDPVPAQPGAAAEILDFSALLAAGSAELTGSDPMQSALPAPAEPGTPAAVPAERAAMPGKILPATLPPALPVLPSAPSAPPPALPPVLPAVSVPVLPQIASTQLRMVPTQQYPIPIEQPVEPAGSQPAALPTPKAVLPIAPPLNLAKRVQGQVQVPAAVPDESPDKPESPEMSLPSPASLAVPYVAPQSNAPVVVQAVQAMQTAQPAPQVAPDPLPAVPSAPQPVMMIAARRPAPVSVSITEPEQPAPDQPVAARPVVAPVAPAEQVRVSVPLASPSRPLAETRTRAQAVAPDPAVPQGADPAPMPQTLVAPVAMQAQAAQPSDPTQPALRPHEFSQLIDRLVAAREAVAPQPVSLTLPHADFGPVHLRFRHEDAGLTVAMTSADPEFARIAGVAAAQALPAAQNEPANSSGNYSAGQNANPGGPRTDSAGTGSTFAQSRQNAGPQRGTGFSENSSRSEPAEPETRRTGIFA